MRTTTIFNKSRILLACLAQCVVVSLFYGGIASAQEMTFQLLRGRASLSRNQGGTWLDLGPQPITVRIPDMLRLESDSRGEIRLGDGSVLRIGPTSNVTLLATGMRLQVGSAWLVLQRRGSPFHLETPTAQCTVLGTSFDVDVDRFGVTRVRVLDGIVAVRAHDDKRHRQLVLQRGMMTSVRDKNLIEDQTQNFNLTAVEASLTSAWDTRRLPPMKLGPARSELPPIRRETSGAIIHATPALTPDGTDVDDRKFIPASVRDRLNFFENLRIRRLQPTRLAPDTGKLRARPLWADTEAPFNSSPPGATRVEIPGEMFRQGHGTAFGHGTPYPTGIEDQRQLRDEILQVRAELARNQEEIARMQREIEMLRSQLPVPSPQTKKMSQTSVSQRGTGSVDAVRRLTGLQTALIALQEDHQKRRQRLEFLQTRMR